VSVDDEHRFGLELVAVDARTFEVHHAGARVFSVTMPPGDPEFGTLRLTPHDRSAGARLVASLAQVFEVEEPSADPQAPLTPVDVDFTSLGREDGVVLTKWFLRVDGQEGEVYFNFDLARRAAEFLEKDPDCAQPVLRSLARMLRDGEPTLESDPRFSQGPRFENERRLKLEGRPMLCQLFENQAVFTLGGQLLSFDLNTGTPHELARFDGQLSARWSPGAKCWVLVVDGAETWLLEDGQLTRLEPPSGCGAGAQVSSDRRWLAFDRWRDATSRHGRFSEIVLVERQTGRTVSALDGERSLHVVEWNPRGVVLSVFEGREARASRFVLLDFETGLLSPAQRTPVEQVVSLERERVLLPGGATVTLTTAERAVVKAEHFSVASPRYLAWKRFDALVFVDVETGRLSVPLERDDRRTLQLVPGFRHVVLRDERTWLVADVRSPQA